MYTAVIIYLCQVLRSEFCGGVISKKTRLKLELQVTSQRGGTVMLKKTPDRFFRNKY